MRLFDQKRKAGSFKFSQVMPMGLWPESTQMRVVNGDRITDTCCRNNGIYPGALL